MNPLRSAAFGDQGAEEMTHDFGSVRRFKVHAWHLDGHHARLVEEASFEAAAVAYLECFDLSIPIEDDHEVRVIVLDVETGHQHCFRVDLESGDTAPCE
jgi:hypothetical protein